MAYTTWHKPHHTHQIAYTRTTNTHRVECMTALHTHHSLAHSACNIPMQHCACDTPRATRQKNNYMQRVFVTFVDWLQKDEGCSLHQRCANAPGSHLRWVTSVPRATTNRVLHAIPPASCSLFLDCLLSLAFAVAGRVRVRSIALSPLTLSIVVSPFVLAWSVPLTQPWTRPRHLRRLFPCLAPCVRPSPPLYWRLRWCGGRWW